MDSSAHTDTADRIAAGFRGGSGFERGSARSGVAVLYTSAVFLSAFLLFWVQPMFGRTILPLLGGSPAVWNTCMLFFQAALLVGYLYAHLSSRLAAPQQTALHLLLFAAVSLVLPISTMGAGPEGGAAPIPWLLARMSVTVGPPFLVLAATGPLLQKWFARSAHPGADDPYWLYAASNLGSFLALLAYPLVVEPRLRLAEQGLAWTAGYAVLGVLMAGCAIRAGGGTDVVAKQASPADREQGSVSLRDRALWVALAFVPSSLFLGVTTYLTTDLTPIPLLWVVPLALYLLSFTLVFARRPPVPHRWMLAAQPALIAVVVLVLLDGVVRRPALALPIHLAALFVTAMVCHGELARRRPPVRHLTEFYLWLAVGGVLGGAFNALLAPVLFPKIWEYPIVLTLACLARPWPSGARSLQRNAGRAVRAGAVTLALLLLTRDEMKTVPRPVYIAAAAGTILLLSVSLKRSPVGLALCVGTLLFVRSTKEMRSADLLRVERSFFGHYHVVRSNQPDGRYHALTHGSTLHGAQSQDPARRREPLTYYLQSGPLGDVFGSVGISTRPLRVAVVGLGTGTAAAYGEPGQEWTFYEIDPGIVRIARDPRLFTYLQDSPADVRVVLGDARLSLSRETDALYDVIVLDAFSSDAVPMHLLTREALGVYLARLAPGGRIAFHISNRYLDLEPVLAALSTERGLVARLGNGPFSRNGRYEQSSSWVVIARSEADLGILAGGGGWRILRSRPDVRPWTDDYSSVLRVLSW